MFPALPIQLRISTKTTTAWREGIAKLEAIRKFNIVGFIPKTKQFINLDHGRGIAKSVNQEVNGK